MTAQLKSITCPLRHNLVIYYLKRTVSVLTNAVNMDLSLSNSITSSEKLRSVYFEKRDRNVSQMDSKQQKKIVFD